MSVRMTVDKAAFDAREQTGRNIVERKNNWDASGPFYIETTYEGVVLFTGEVNGYDDSDFYAVVWDAAAGETKRVFYGTTRGWTYENGANADATPEVRAAYEACVAEQAAKERKWAAAERAARPEAGKRVKIVKGRKIPKGVEGQCFWRGAGGYGKDRVGFKTDSGETLWTDVSNVAVVQLEAAVA